MSNGEGTKKKGGRKEEEYRKSKIHKESKIPCLHYKMIAFLLISMFFCLFCVCRARRDFSPYRWQVSFSSLRDNLLAKQSKRKPWRLDCFTPFAM